MSLIEKSLAAVKSAVFERGRLIYWLNIPAFRRSARRVEARGRGEKLRLGFILQVPNNWAVIQPVFEAAVADEAVEPVVILMPELEYRYYVRLEKVIWESVYAFGREQFPENCGAEVVRAWDPETEAWLDPASLRLDDVFIPRPYETYLPPAWRALHLRKITRVCFVPYSSPLLDDYPLMYNMHFIRNVGRIFCEKKHSYDYVASRLAPTVKSGDQKVYDTGFPKFDGIRRGENQESPVWPRPRQPGVFRVLWTPRWTLDARLGGSSFFTYKDQMIGWAEEDRSIDLVFRPHPLALDTYVREGWMTAEEQQEYLRRYEACENAAVDRARTYFDTFFSSDVLITDISSMLMDYLFTGRPILFCPTPAGKTMSDDPRFAVQSLMEGMYVVHSFEEIQEQVKKLAAGEDPKREARARLARNMGRDGHIGRDILEILKKG